MDDETIWQILIDTPQSFPDGLKFVALVIPPTMMLALLQVYFVCRRIRALTDLTGDAPTPETPGRWFSWLPPRVDYPSQQFLPPLPPVPPVPPVPRPQARQRQRQRRQGDRTETGKQGFPQTPPGLPKGPMCGVGED